MAALPSGHGGDDIPEPAGLRRLRHMVTFLTVSIILGVITVVALLVIRLAQIAPSQPPALPPVLALPPGETVRAVTLGTGWVAVVSADPAGSERIRVFDAASGAERGTLVIAPLPD